MARPLFRWEHFPQRLLRRLAEAAGLPQAEVADALGERYGVPPGEDFIHDVWPVLVDAWLKADRASAAVIAARLRDAGLGDRGNTSTSTAATMRYLRGCSSTPPLGAIVLAAFVATGAAPTSSASLAPRRRRSRKKSGQGFRLHVEGLVRELLAVGELAVDGDGVIRLPRGGAVSFLRTFDDPEQVQILRPLAVGVTRTPELLEALNDLNAEISFARVFVIPSGDVILALDIRGADVRAEDLSLAMAVHDRLADTLDNDLQGRFGRRQAPEIAEDSVTV